MSRRVTIKTLLLNQHRASPQSLPSTCAIYRARWCGPRWRVGPSLRAADRCRRPRCVQERCADDRHHFRFILSPEDGAELEDLRTYTRHLMGRMEADLARPRLGGRQSLEHRQPAHAHRRARARRHRQRPHHRGRLHRRWVPPSRRRTGDRMAGPRTELEIQQTLRREVDQERWTSLDRTSARPATMAWCMSNGSTNPDCNASVCC